MSDLLLTIEELQKLTKEAESTWRKRLARGEIAYLKLGACVRVRRQDFEAWLQECTIKREREALTLAEYSIDDLHAMATAELDEDADAVATLHTLYARLRDQYIAAYTDLRARAS